MKRNTFLFTLLIFFITGTFAQNKLYYNSYDWDKNPEAHVPDEKDKKSDLIVVLDKKIHEVTYDSDGQAVLYETVHRIFHVNSNRALDAVNKGYIPLKGVFEEMNLKARCITGDNKVIHFNTGSIKHVDNLEGAGPYKIFAVDGVETGCDVEILYTNKRQFLSYAYMYAQGKNPIKTLEKRIICPKNLVFETKSYNGLEEFRKDTSDAEKNQLVLVHRNIPPAKEEKYSSDKANYMAYIFQLAYNTSRKNSKIYTWDIISKELYDAYFNLEKNEAKGVEKALKANRILSQPSALDKISALDAYIKTNFELSENYDALGFSKALETKKMSEGNVVRFYIAAMKHMQIPFELALSCDRTDLLLDPKFPSYMFTKEFLMYFPEQEKFVSPANIYSRPGFPDPYQLNNHALFIKEVSIGDMKAPVARTRLLPTTTLKDTYHNMELKARLDFAARNVKLDVKHLMTGYSAYYIQPVYRYLNNEQKEQIHRNYYLSDNSQSVKDLVVENTGEEELFKKPFIVKYSSEQNDFLESAGNKFLFKVGLLIGTQSELYEEEERTTPGDVVYPHYLERHIELNIPEGYKVTNAEELVISKNCLVDGNEAAVFRSSYEIREGKMFITVYEDYGVAGYPLESYNAFKSVINAAADFNKKTLIFEKL